MDDAPAESNSRRNLIKAAVAAGVGVAAYSAPRISSVPVHAIDGGQSPVLGSIDRSTGVNTVQWSPNQDSANGNWLCGVTTKSGACQEKLGATAATKAVRVTYPETTMGGNRVIVTFTASPNNGTTSAATVASDCLAGNVDPGDQGPGLNPGSGRATTISFESFNGATTTRNANCELILYDADCSKQDCPVSTPRCTVPGKCGENIDPNTINAGGASSLLVSSTSGAATTTYRSGRTGAWPGTGGGKARCFLTFYYEVRCINVKP